MKKTFFIVGIICILAITASLVYYLVYYIPHRDNEETTAEIEAETESYCACLRTRIDELVESEGKTERCNEAYPDLDDTEGWFKCMDAGRLIVSSQADRECREQYPRTTKSLNFTENSQIKCE